MPIDVYSLCPGGTGKKIKFCCSDFLPELQKIDRMLEGEQNVACLQHVDRLLQDTPDRACLLAIKGALLRAAGEAEAASANAAHFVEKHPGNSTALAESAIMTAVTRGGQAAMPDLQRAIVAAGSEIQSRVYDAVGLVAQMLLTEGHWLAGRALLHFQLAMTQDDEQPVEMLVDVNRSADVPLLFKDDHAMADCPADAPWRQRFVEAMAPVSKGQWQVAADNLAALAADVPDAPPIWRNLATLRGWLADSAGCVEALRKLAALAVPLEDAVEAETLAMFLSEDPFGDAIDVLSLTWTVHDVERLHAALLSDGRVGPVPFDPAAFAEENTPPPKGAFFLADRPAPEDAENLTLETLPSFLGKAMLFGRETDREARLQVFDVTATDLPQVKMLLAELGGDALDAAAEEEVTVRVSLSHERLRRKWRVPRNMPREQLASLTLQHQRKVLLEKWPQLQLGIFAGKSPHEVAADPACRVKLLAAILMLQLSSPDQVPGEFDFNELRSQLRLPVLGSIDPADAPVARVPLVRLARVMIEKLADEELLLGYRRAVAFGVAGAIGKYALAVVDRPSLAERGESLRAYSVLARTSDDPEKALEYVELGRKAAAASGRSSASWDLLELSFRFARGESEQAIRLVNHLQKEHIREPGVADALTNMLIDVGVLRPDGTPAAVPTRAPAPFAAEPAAEAGKIWTPESQQPAGERKLWTPE